MHSKGITSAKLSKSRSHTKRICKSVSIRQKVQYTCYLCLLTLHDSNVFAYSVNQLYKTVHWQFQMKILSKICELIHIQMGNGSIFMLCFMMDFLLNMVIRFRGYSGLIISLVILLLKTNDPTFMKSGSVSSTINNQKTSSMDNNIGSNPK